LSEVKIERAGVFAYSPEEGTAAALMERPDTDTAQKRAAEVEELQEQIMESFDRSRIGTETTVLVEEAVCDSDIAPSTTEPSPGALVRSYAESPDVDGYILIKGGEIKANTFIDVLVTGIENGELVGEQVLI